MKKSRYLYVEVRGWFEEPCSMTMTDDPISFDHVVVEAFTDQEADALGAAAMDTKHAETSEAADNGHCTGRFLNWYVVKL